jgi:hypothetical protein
MKSSWAKLTKFAVRSNGSVITIVVLMVFAEAIVGSQALAQDTFTVLHPFTWAQYPEGALARDAAGNLYGTTMQDAGGGNGCGGFGCGTVWKLARNPDGTWTSTILHAFTGADGSKPDGIILDASGNIYGIATLGGNMSACHALTQNGCGLLYKLTHNSNGSWTYSVLHEFASSDGAIPEGILTFDADGNLYGATTGGGNITACQAYLISGCGLVFMLGHDSNGLDLQRSSRVCFLRWSGSEGVVDFRCCW